jgi:hypothetical protein
VVLRAAGHELAAAAVVLAAVVQLGEPVHELAAVVQLGEPVRELAAVVQLGEPVRELAAGLVQACAPAAVVLRSLSVPSGPQPATNAATAPPVW